jgi:hypothetical protein
MLLAKLAVHQIPSSTKERTDCSSSLATLVDLDEVLLLSRLVSLLKSEREEDNRVRWVYYATICLYEGALRGKKIVDRYVFGWRPYCLHICKTVSMVFDVHIGISLRVNGITSFYY